MKRKSGLLLVACLAAMVFMAMGARVPENLASLTAAEREEMQRKWQQFEGLLPAKQDQLRQLHRDLQQADDSQQLQGVLGRYCEWLKTLPPKQRAMLADLPPESRITRITQIKQQQEERRRSLRIGKALTDADMRNVVRWWFQFLRDHERTILASIPPEQRQEFRGLRAPERQRRLMKALRKIRPPLHPSDDEIRRLIDQLSPAAKQVLEGVSDLEQREEILRLWLMESLQVRRSRRTIHPATSHGPADPLSWRLVETRDVGIVRTD